jgi:hypothetical protein
MFKSHFGDERVMVSRQDIEKRQAWEARFERFRASGLSVARFCEQERVSVHTFYYWAKRVGSNSAKPSSSGTGKTLRRNCPSVRPAATTARIASAPLVRFSWNAGGEVSVPADCLDAIRCLAECLQHTRAECPDAFQELVVRS